MRFLPKPIVTTDFVALTHNFYSPLLRGYIIFTPHRQNNIFSMDGIFRWRSASPSSNSVSSVEITFRLDDDLFLPTFAVLPKLTHSWSHWFFPYPKDFRRWSSLLHLLCPPLSSLVSLLPCNENTINFPPLPPRCSFFTWRQINHMKTTDTRRKGTPQLPSRIPSSPLETNRTGLNSMLSFESSSSPTRMRFLKTPSENVLPFTAWKLLLNIPNHRCASHTWIRIQNAKETPHRNVLDSTSINHHVQNRALVPTGLTLGTHHAKHPMLKFFLRQRTQSLPHCFCDRTPKISPRNTLSVSRNNVCAGHAWNEL